MVCATHSTYERARIETNGQDDQPGGDLTAIGNWIWARFLVFPFRLWCKRGIELKLL